MTDENGDISDELMGELLSLCRPDEHSKPNDGPILEELKAIEHKYGDSLLLNEGGMKRISKVYEHSSARFVAMATLKDKAPRELIEPFLREARITATLDHPNIIKVYDIGVKADQPYFTMELKTGPNLAIYMKTSSTFSGLGWFKDDGVELRKRIDLFHKVCDAVSYAHYRKVLHLDLKPENIQVGEYGEVLVCDWGLAKIIGRDQVDEEVDDLLLNPDLLNHMTSHHQMRGTPGYMPPEQIKKGEEVDVRSDIYALGGILYSILCNRPPLDGETQELIDLTLEGNITPPRMLCPEMDIPIGLQAVVMKAISPVKERRYSDVRSMIQDLEKYLNGFPTDAENAGLLRRASLFYRRHQKLVLTMMVASLMLLLSLLIYVVKLKRSETFARESQLKAEWAKDEAVGARLLAEQERQRAEEMRQRSELANKQAQQHLNTFIMEINKTRFNIMNSYFIYNPKLTMRMAWARIDELMIHGPLMNFTWGDRGDLHFLEHNYASAYRDYLKCGESWVQGRVLTLKNMQLTSHQGPLEHENMKELVKQLGRDKSLQNRVLAVHLFDKRSLKKHTELIEVAMREENPHWKGTFRYHEKSGTLTLGGTHLRQLRRKYHSVFGTLNVHALELRNTKVNLSELKGLLIRKLIILGPIQGNIRELLKMSNIAVLEVEKDMVSPNHQEWLKSEGISVHIISL